MSSIADQGAIQDQGTTRSWYEKSYIQVLIGIGLGALVGYLWPDVGVSLKPLGDALIKTIKMAIAPIVFLTVVHGIASLDDMSRYVPQLSQPISPPAAAPETRGVISTRIERQASERKRLKIRQRELSSRRVKISRLRRPPRSYDNHRRNSSLSR